MRIPTRPYPYVALLMALAAGFVIVTTFAFGHGTANAIDFGISIGLTAASVGAYLVGTSRLERAGALASYLVGAWAILVTAGVFSGSTQRWLTFASAAAIVGLSVAGQVVALARDRSPAVRPVARPKAA